MAFRTRFQLLIWPVAITLGDFVPAHPPTFFLSTPDSIWTKFIPTQYLKSPNRTDHSPLPVTISIFLFHEKRSCKSTEGFMIFTLYGTHKRVKISPTALGHGRASMESFHNSYDIRYAPHPTSEITSLTVLQRFYFILRLLFAVESRLLPSFNCLPRRDNLGAVNQADVDW